MTSAQFRSNPDEIRVNRTVGVSYYFRTKGKRPVPFERMLTAAEAADILRLGVWSTVKLCRTGELPATKPGKTWLIAESDLMAYLEDGSNQKRAAS